MAVWQKNNCRVRRFRYESPMLPDQPANLGCCCKLRIGAHRDFANQRESRRHAGVELEAQEERRPHVNFTNARRPKLSAEQHKD